MTICWSFRTSVPIDLNLLYSWLLLWKSCWIWFMGSLSAVPSNWFTIFNVEKDLWELPLLSIKWWQWSDLMVSVSMVHQCEPRGYVYLDCFWSFPPFGWSAFAMTTVILFGCTLSFGCIALSCQRHWCCQVTGRSRSSTRTSTKSRVYGTRKAGFDCISYGDQNFPDSTLLRHASSSLTTRSHHSECRNREVSSYHRQRSNQFSLQVVGMPMARIPFGILPSCLWWFHSVLVSRLRYLKFRPRLVVTQKRRALSPRSFIG